MAVIPDNDTDYLKYRGRCEEMSRELCRQDPTLRLVRGHYICPMWGEQSHWWCVTLDGTIVDPTARQFPSKGTGKYIEWDGIIACAECGKAMKEEETWRVEGRYGFCSHMCYGRFIGVLDESGKLMGEEF